MHPRWYYKLYDELFGWSRDYSKEIEIIDKIVSLKNKIIEEIGSGTGKHTEELLNKSPLILNAIDYDRQAIDLLKIKFAHLRNLNIVLEDGFKRNEFANIIICLYSIIQQTEEESILIKRVENLIHRIDVYACDVLIEVIDTELHNSKKYCSYNIYEDGENSINLESIETEYGTLLRYYGSINNLNVEYKVPLCRFPFTLLDSKTNISYDSIPLSKSNRKKLLHIYKKRY